eukprot:scaffold47500_cov105-Phaeocystis_antarctica.AAC.1
MADLVYQFGRTVRLGRNVQRDIFSGCPYGDTTIRVSGPWLVAGIEWFRPLLGGCVDSTDSRLELFSFSFLALRCPGKPSGSGGLGPGHRTLRARWPGSRESAALAGDYQACMGPQGERYQEEEHQRSREAATWTHRVCQASVTIKSILAPGRGGRRTPTLMMLDESEEGAGEEDGEEDGRTEK